MLIFGADPYLIKFLLALNDFFFSTENDFLPDVLIELVSIFFFKFEEIVSVFFYL